MTIVVEIVGDIKEYGSNNSIKDGVVGGMTK